MILEYEGSKYIVDLAKYFKEKKIVMTKKKLQEFIDSRQGP